MSTGATAIAITANTNAVIALEKAKGAACLAEMPGFQHNSATVEEMQGYAECVYRLHPEDTGLAHIVAWVVLSCMILGAVITGVQYWRSRCSWVLVDFAMIYFMWTTGFLTAAFIVSALAVLFTHL